MMLEVCTECGHIFSEEEAIEVSTTYEAYYGVSDLFSNSTPMTYLICPQCRGDRLEKYEEEFKTDLERIEKIRNLDWEGKRNEFTEKI